MKNIPVKFLKQDNEMESLMPFPSGIWTSESLTKESLKNIGEWLKSLPQDSLASPFQSQGNEKESKTKEICGLTPLNAFALYNHDTHTWKTSQACLLPAISDEYTETWPKQGIMLDGVCWELTMWEPHTGERDGGYWLTPSTIQVSGGEDRIEKRTAYRKSIGRKYVPGSLAEQVKWPTPRAQDGPHGPAKDSLGDKVRWPTPRAKEGMSHKPGTGGKSLKGEIGGQLNPDWVEWLMGWPIGWTDLKPLEMDRFQKWLKQHGRC